MLFQVTFNSHQERLYPWEISLLVNSSYCIHMCCKYHSNCLLIRASPLPGDCPRQSYWFTKFSFSSLLSSPLLFSALPSLPLVCYLNPLSLWFPLIIHNFLLNAIRVWGEKVLEIQSLWEEDCTLDIWLSVCFLQTPLLIWRKLCLCLKVGGTPWLWSHLSHHL